jgi:membrane protease YdiL (CAAX protease family)
MFSAEKPLNKALYLVGVVVIFVAVYIQYFVPLGQISGYLVVYGIPAVTVTLIFGKTLLPRAAKNSLSAFKNGLGLFGVLTIVGFVFSFIALAIILQFNPNALDLLSKPNPVLDVSPTQAWVLIAVSMLVVGPVEEYLFRGFMYGGLLNIFKGKHWLPLAIISSVMFAAVHGYYAVTYEVASVIPFITLTTFGIAMAVTYYWSGGNILAPALIHGLYDATGFLGAATTTSVGLAARFILIAVGGAFAIYYILIKKVRIDPNKFRDTPTEPPQPAPPQTPTPPA